MSAIIKHCNLLTPRESVGHLRERDDGGGGGEDSGEFWGNIGDGGGIQLEETLSSTSSHSCRPLRLPLSSLNISGGALGVL